MLYLVATPIGNLEDFSSRAISTLMACDYILCEDTRHSRILIQRYAIQTPLKAFHQFNEARSEDPIIEDLKAGRAIGMISDAGTPLVSDPGHELVLRCRKEGIAVTAVPGPCAVIQALVLSGFPAEPFQFVGFLPKKESELRTTLGKAVIYPGTTIAYESPHRIEETLEQMVQVCLKRQLCAARELTKLHEEVLVGTAQELLDHFRKTPPRGEFVLLISPPSKPLFFEDHSLVELVEMFEKDLHLSKMEAIKMAAQLRGVPKKEVYKEFVND
jgi:16S rRNA (cytidine1402-2'-O)-methyltransferase